MEQVIEAFNRTLYTEGVEEILVITAYEFLHHPMLRQNDDDFYIPLRLRKGIRMRSLVSWPGLPDKGAKSEKKFLRQRRFLPEKFTFPGTFYIFGDAVLYFSASNEEYMAMIIESKAMSQTMRVLHTFMWEALVEPLNSNAKMSEKQEEVK